MCLGITVEPESQTKATGQTIELTCDVYGTSTDSLMYQWIIPRQYLGFLYIDIVNGSKVLTIPNATVSDSGVYSCVVFTSSNSNTGVQSDSANVTIIRKLYSSESIELTQYFRPRIIVFWHVCCPVYSYHLCKIRSSYTCICYIRLAYA